MNIYRSFALLLWGLLISANSVLAIESTMPPEKYAEIIKPGFASKYTYIEDGNFDEACNLPTYEWLPKDQPAKAVIIGIHGLTLHGRRYRVLARTMAVNGIAFVAPDMLGFGKNRFDEKWQHDGEKKKARTRAHHERSYEAIVKLAQAVRQKYPTIPVICAGESLGCTFAVRLAAEHPELITGIILSAPAVKVNPLMYASPGDIKAGLKAMTNLTGMVNLKGFFTNLVSGRSEVVNEMFDDPYIVKELSLGELVSTDEFVEKTVKWGKNIDQSMPILIIQGSADKCVVPKHVTDLMMVIPSQDQQVSWRGSFGHLQLETAFMRASIIDSIGDWLQDHSTENRARLEELEKNVADLGGTLVR